MQTFSVNIDNVNQRIDNFLIRKFKNVPRVVIYCLIRKGKVKINNARTKPSYKLKNLDEIKIKIFYKRNEKNLFYNKKIKLNFFNLIIYEDNYILAINKPTGTAVHSGSKINVGLIEKLRFLYKENGFLELVHRLDRETSGVLLIAKRKSVLRKLHEELRNRKIEKKYLLLVHGRWPLNKKNVKASIIRSIKSSNKHVMKIDKQGKYSETKFKIKRYFNNFTLLYAYPLTGRTHQIRIHAKYAGHPIVFDELYGNKFLDSKYKKYNIDRLFLHALSLHFKHPISGNKLFIKASIDNKMKKCLSKIDKIDKLL